MNEFKTSPINFIRHIIDEDLTSGKYASVHTRFSPEPNGYLHIGHAKSIVLNFGIAQDYLGQCNLRFDDTNPVQEDRKYIEAIKHDVQWLGFHWDGEIHYASDYFEKFYSYAIELINQGLAYVDELSPENIREYRGTLNSPGKNSPYRDRSIEDNLGLFSRMRYGKFEEGCACLRAKIDMGSPFIIMRDPVLYRIKFSSHHQTGNKWCIYPMYDFAHCISDALEGITHSLCTLEFQDNRQLYDWILDHISINNIPPHQYEFSRLNLEYTVLSKRKIHVLISKNIVEDWDDPRIPTIAGLRRRGYTAASIREFCRRIGVTKQNSNVKISELETCIREDLNEHAPRVMAVINPVKVVIDNLPEGYEEDVVMPNHPNKHEMGTRQVAFSREILIDRADFREEAADKQYKRLILGKEIRLRHAYVIKAERVEKDEHGEITTIYCSYDPKTLNKNPVDGRKVQGVIHWVSFTRSVAAEFRLYDRLFIEANPDALEDFLVSFNPKSLIIRYGFAESVILKYGAGAIYQFEREGYFCADIDHFSSSRPVFNLTVRLRNTTRTFEMF